MAKRFFDIVLSLLVLVPAVVVMLFGYLLASFDTRSNGVFLQNRVGRFGRPFVIFKLKTIHPQSRAITATGKFLRKYKLDELPQLFNVLLGQMSFVGPRPDVKGYYDTLEGEFRKILELRPGITSEAAIKYQNEDEILFNEADPLKYNDEVIFPDKVRMNLEYYYKKTVWLDVKIIWRTAVSRI